MFEDFGFAVAGTRRMSTIDPFLAAGSSRRMSAMETIVTGGRRNSGVDPLAAPAGPRRGSATETFGGGGGESRNSSTMDPAMTTRFAYTQEPVAVIGMSCRLPGDNNTPAALWEFLQKGGVARNEPPESRFNLKGHHDGSKKTKTMRTAGGMFLENVDPQDFDAQFFGTSRVDAIAMDPQQRQLLEVVYEGLENAGITLESLDGQAVGCFVGSYAVDYSDMHNRDPEDRPPGVTVGVGRAILSNRLSHFLNIKGPSFTVDTACSGSLVAVDVACRYLNTGEINGAIVAASNLYLSPEHNMDGGAMKGAASLSGRCHTFDIKADGYCKAEAVNAVILKRLGDAIRDGDPIRAIIRGSATNSDGKTPGIASPSAEAQSAAIRSAYANAGISDYNATTYLECHGTGTQAGDPIEVTGAATVFGPNRPANRPLLIGSIKSNIGHSEPAAGISGLLKAILSLENGKIIPGNPTFLTPNPKIDFHSMKVHAFKNAITWPPVPFRRVSVNSFGYGGSNAHVVLDEAKTIEAQSQFALSHTSSYIADYDDFFDEEESTRPYVLVFSANDEVSLKAYTKKLSRHLINPNVNVKLPDLAFTLSERRSRHFHRGFVVANSTTLDEGAFVFGKKTTDAPRIGFIFTGQGAQWSQMGKGLVETFPAAKLLLKHYDDVLQSLPTPPKWSLLTELTEARSAETLRLPEFSQPLVTALQLVMIAILRTWGVEAQGVAGHSSGEIAAAAAAGLLTPEEAIKVAYYRGQAAINCEGKSDVPVGMLAVGLGPKAVQKYLAGVETEVSIACYNSPDSVTLSGSIAALEKVAASLKSDSHFARMLQVNLAYHSKFMSDIANEYEDLLKNNCDKPPKGKDGVSMFSSVTGEELDRFCTPAYWKSNMVSPVRFDEAVRAMVDSKTGADFLIEIGPSGALAGPVKQIKKALGGKGSEIQYCAASSRGSNSVNALFEVAGRLFVAGGQVNLAAVNRDTENEMLPKVIVDLPNYVWNHSTKYWYENESSKDWRYRLFPHHDLLGSKVLGTSWHSPIFKKVLRVDNLKWLKDHKMGNDIVLPAAAFCAMAIEALYQSRMGVHMTEGSDLVDKPCYRLRNVTFPRALVLSDDAEGSRIMLALNPRQGPKDSWYEFRISSLTEDVWTEHSRGLVRAEEDLKKVGSKEDLQPLRHATPGHQWYKAMSDAGYSFGPLFQKHLETETVSGERSSRSIVSLTEPAEDYQQSSYPMHPVCIDGCFQTVGPSLWRGNRSTVSAVLLPAMIDSLIINTTPLQSKTGISVTSSRYVGVGRADDTKNSMSDCSVYDHESGALLLKLSGLRYSRLDAKESPHASHSFSRLDWKPDITYLNQEKLPLLGLDEIHHATNDDCPGRIQQMMDLVAHKKPNLKVMEVNMIAADTSSIWLEGDNFDKTTRAAVTQYHLAAMDATALMTAQEKFSMHSKAEFSMLDLTKPPQDVFPKETEFDLLIVKLATVSEATLTHVVRNAHTLLSEGGHLILVETLPPSAESDSDDTDIVLVHGNDVTELKNTAAILDANRFHGTLRLFSQQQSLDTLKIAHVSRARAKVSSSVGADCPIALVHLSKATDTSTSLKNSLVRLGWEIEDHVFPFHELAPQSIVLILDDLSNPLLASVRERQWQSIKELTYKENRILWVTAGSQLKVTNPDNAMIHGLGRTIRAEDPNVSLTTLDVESASGSETLLAIHRILGSLEKPAPRLHIENEFVERRGIIHVSRIRPDDPVNQVEKDLQGGEVVPMDFHESETCIRLRCERIGTLDSLRFAEVSEKELPLADNMVEVEIVAAGVNFKDVAVTMGIVPENEHLPGLEGAGTVRRVGRSVNSVKIGERVLVYEKGTFANRVQLTAERTHRLPDSMSFEDAATMPSVYLVALYGLFHVAKLQQGQSVLIHSASGGVGVAAIQLCRYIGVSTIFVTVGNDDKKKFLMEQFDIPADHIFHSRNTQFASQILEATNGRGIDVVLNSLTGDLLDESWRLVADGGHLVEIGKRDVLDRNSLAMEPFNRNCSYHGVDMSHLSISDPLIARLLTELMALVMAGHVKPIAPIKVFPFEDIISALRYLRGGTHLGKIVISNGPDAKIEVPVRPAPRELSLPTDVSYLIVGGLKGLCGSLALYLARARAKHLVILSRSGYSDDRSQGVLKNIYAEGCEVDLMKGDVSNADDVNRVFKTATKPIAGVIQGAMVLRDKVFTSMTVNEFHETITSKVTGTWNLHNASLSSRTPLQFFTLLSSISGVVGQKGQANYSAANVFLDNFAAYRNSLSLPACSVDLGVIEDVGYVAEHQDLKFDRDVWTPINESLLHKVLKMSLLQQSAKPVNKASTSQLITGIAIPQQGSSALMRDARFGPLVFGDANGSSSGSSSSGAASQSAKAIAAFKLQLTQQAEHSLLLASVVAIINAQFTTSLRLEAPMEEGKSLASYGLDSLAAVEFRNWVRMELGAELSTLEITGASSLWSLGDKILGKIKVVEAGPK